MNAESNKKAFTSELLHGLLVSLPSVLIAFTVSCTLLLTYISTSEARQGRVVGEAIAGQLAHSLPEYLLTDDRLSLTVILDRLVTDGVFSTAAIYGADDRLVATAGGTTPSRSSQFTAEIQYQDSVAGYVRISLQQDRLFGSTTPVLSALIISHILIWLLAGYLFVRFSPTVGSPAKEESDDEPVKQTRLRLPIVRQPVSVPVIDYTQYSLLVTKIEPARFLPRIEAQLRRAISIHQGRIDSIHEDEVVALFHQKEDHSFHAICGAILIRMVVDQISNCKIRCAIHTGHGEQELNAARKQARYYCSVTDKGIVVSQSIHREHRIADRVHMTEFHSSRAPDTQLYKIQNLIEKHQLLVDSQLRQL